MKQIIILLAIILHFKSQILAKENKSNLNNIILNLRELSTSNTQTTPSTTSTTNMTPSTTQTTPATTSSTTTTNSQSISNTQTNSLGELTNQNIKQSTIVYKDYLDYNLFL